MGKIQRIRLGNFKSYAGQCDISMGDHHFVSIIGPNGAGKSNLMEAIAFVFDTEHPSTRCSSLSDFVNREDPFTDTFVECTYSQSDSLVVLTRVVSSNALLSIYKIDGQEVPQGEYRAMLKSMNIPLMCPHHMVFQGDVESVAEKTPLELSQLVEQISGAAGYREEYEQVSKDIEVQERLLEAKIVNRRSLQTDQRQFEVSHQQKQQYEGLKAEQVEVKKRILKLKRLDINYRLESTRESLDIQKADAVTTRQRKAALLKKSSETTAQVAKYHKETLDLGNQISLLKAKEVRFEAEIEHVRLRRDQVVSEFEQLAPKYTELESEKDGCLKEIKFLKRDAKVVERAQVAGSKLQKQQLQKLAELDPTVPDYYESRKAQAAQATFSQRFRLDDYTQQLKILRQACDSLESNISVQEDRKGYLNLQKSSTESEIDTHQLSLDKFESQLVAKSTEASENTNELETLRNQEARIRSQLATATAQLRVFDGISHETTRRNKLFDNVAKLKRLFPGVFDVLSNLVQPKEAKYQRALDSILGGHFDSVVVDTPETAKACMAQLRRDSSGRLTFVPLSSLKIEPLEQKWRQIDAEATLALDSLIFDNKIKPAVRFVCGNTLVCDTLKTATRLRTNKNINEKIVCVENGEVHHANNTMTGGATGTIDRFDQCKLVSLQRQTESDAKELQALNNYLKTLSDREMSIAAEIRRLHEAISNKKCIIETQRCKIASFDKELEHLRCQLERDMARYRETESAIHELYAQQAIVEGEIAEIEKSFFVDFKEFAGISPQDYECLKSQESDRAMELMQQKTKLEELQLLTLRRLESASLRLSTLSMRKSELSCLTVELGNHLESLQKERDSTSSDMKRLQKKLRLEEKKMEKARESLLDSDTTVQSLAEEVMLKNHGASEIEMTVKQLEAELETLNRSALLDGLEEDVNEDEMDQDDDVTGISSTRLIDEATRQLNYVDKQLSSLVVHRHTDEYLEETRQLLHDLDEGIDVCRVALSELQERKSKIRAARRNAFMRTFEVLQNSIGETYKELTTTHSHRFGGSASLTLIDEDEPFLTGISYSVQPPSKRFCSLQQLSGGERTMASMALLFTIHRCQELPFFVLDEIDAALDYANVALVGRYFRRHASQQCQIIVISLKLRMYEKADHLIGITRNNSPTTQAFMINLPVY